jgi:hypothetical protein
MTAETMKFMNTTTWLRDLRERFGGGGVPVSGRSASFAVFGIIGLAGADRCPNSPLLSGLVFMKAYLLNLRRISSGTVEANMAKLTERPATGTDGRLTDHPL